MMHGPGLRSAKTGARCLAAGLILSLLWCGAAMAGSPRSQRTIAGVRATIAEYDNALLDGNGKAGCALLTASAQSQIAKQNHAASCEKVIEGAHELLEAAPKEAAQIRAYAGKVHVTLRGDTASVPQLSGSAHTTLTFTHHLWFVSSES